MIEDIEQLISSAVTEVFGTMLNFKVTLDLNNPPLANGESHVAGSIGFIGRTTGVLFIYSTNSFARCMTSSLLGLTDQEIDGDEMVNDTIGELANMVVGHIKSRLSDRGIPCVLTIPSIVRGNSFTIEPVSSTERKVFVFQCDGRQLVVEVMLRNA